MAHYELQQVSSKRGGRRSISDLEADRLSSINCRTACLTFYSMRELPSITDLLNICPSYPPQCVVVGPNHQQWCFLVFPSVYDREMAEDLIHSSFFKGRKVRVDATKKLVPIVEKDLERTRQSDWLAVHGLAARTTRRDLEDAFPGCVKVNIASRGGSAFLQFRDRREAEREFRMAENMYLRGDRVVVMYSHSFEYGKSIKNDLRGKIRTTTRGHYEHKFYGMEVMNRGGLKRSRSRSLPDRQGGENSRYYSVKTENNVDSEYLGSVKIKVKKPRISESLSLSLSPSPTPSTTITTRPLSQILKPELIPSSEYDTLYRVLVTQLAGVGLSQAVAQDRAHDIVKLWKETGYKMDNLREVLDKVEGRGELRKELCRIVKLKCKNMAKKMNIDISAMVDITVAFLIESKVKIESPTIDDDSSSPCTLFSYIHKELLTLGMKATSASREVSEVINILSELSLSIERLEAIFTMIVGDNKMGGLTEFHKILERKLSKGCWNSRYLTPRLAAGLMMEYLKDKDSVKTVVNNNKEKLREVDKILNTVRKKLDTSEGQKCVESMPLGFPRMGANMASRLMKKSKMTEEECVELARSMIGTWVSYGFRYSDLANLYEGEIRGENSKSGLVSLIRYRKHLHEMLRNKTSQGLIKPKDFRFSELIDLTVFYFENTD